jgi:hypothetical protein
LLITDKAGPSADAPLTLEGFLRGEPSVVIDAIIRVAEDIASQLQMFGDSR